MARMALAGGLVIDGLGGPGRVADVIVEGPTIVSIDAASDYHPGMAVRDATGHVVAPGFIDVHSHADNAPLLGTPDCSKIHQGVTTEVVGNCGMSLAPRSARYAHELASYLGRLFPPTSWQGYSFSDFLRATDAAVYVVNYAPLVGHGTLRLAVRGFEPGEPTAAELDAMRALLEAALDAGAIGLSTGLIYPPGSLAATDELVELSRLLPQRAGIYTTHIRNEASGLLDAVAEAITIGRQAGVRVQISHHKALGRRNWGAVEQSLVLIAAARAEGIDVRLDAYPYTASSTLLTVCLPPWLSSLGDRELLDRLQEPLLAERLRHELGRDDWDNQVAGCGGFAGILIASTRDHRFEGMTLAEVAQALGTDGAGALLHILIEEQLVASMVSFGMDEDDVERVLRDPWTSIGSDGLPPGMGGNPHPRQWGTFPRVLGRYVRERQLLPLEEAIRRMTSLAADTFRFPGIGRIAPGYAADLVVFEPNIVRDRATYLAPAQPPEGIRDVFIGGALGVKDGAYTELRAGCRLRHASTVA